MIAFDGDWYGHDDTAILQSFVKVKNSELMQSIYSAMSTYLGTERSLWQSQVVY